MIAAIARKLRATAAGLLALALLPIGLTGCNRAHSTDVVATVNGHAILRVDMDKRYTNQLGESPGQQPSNEEADSLRLSIVRELIVEEIYEQRAAKMNLTATDAEVDAKLAAMKAPYTEEQFTEQLKAIHHTLDDEKHDLRLALTIEKLLNKEINSKVTVSDADIANYFNQHKEEFDLMQTQYHLAQVQVTGIPSAHPGNLQGSKATSDAEAKKKIQALKVRLDSGEDFGVIAMNFSEDPDTAPSGGDMGFVLESKLNEDPTVGAAILKLKPGQITDIFPLLDRDTRKPFGYAIYKLIAREPAGQRELSDPVVQQHIRQQLHDGRATLLKAAYLDMLRDQAKVENFFAEQIFKNDAK